MAKTNFSNKYCKNGHLLIKTHRTFKRKENGKICNRCNKCDTKVRHRKNATLKKNGTFTDYNRKFALKAKYGITIEDFNLRLKRQKFKCAIGRETEHGHTNWIVDHCHKTGKVRGILCKKCNSGIAFLNESVVKLKAAIRYLK